MQPLGCSSAALLFILGEGEEEEDAQSWTTAEQLYGLGKGLLLTELFQSQHLGARHRVQCIDGPSLQPPFGLVICDITDILSVLGPYLYTTDSFGFRRGTFQRNTNFYSILEKDYQLKKTIYFLNEELKMGELNNVCRYVNPVRRCWPENQVFQPLLLASASPWPWHPSDSIIMPTWRQLSSLGGWGETHCWTAPVGQ